MRCYMPQRFVEYICMRCQCIICTCGLHIYMMYVNFKCAVLIWSAVYACVWYVFICSAVVGYDEYICCVWVV